MRKSFLYLIIIVIILCASACSQNIGKDILQTDSAESNTTTVIESIDDILPYNEEFTPSDSEMQIPEQTAGYEPVGSGSVSNPSINIIDGSGM